MSTLKVSEFAELVGVSTRTVSDLVKRGVISKIPGGLPHPEALQSYVTHLRELAAARGGSAAVEVSSHRATLLKIQADRAQFQFECEKDLWVTIDDAEIALVFNLEGCARRRVGDHHAHCVSRPRRDQRNDPRDGPGNQGRFNGNGAEGLPITTHYHRRMRQHDPQRETRCA